MGYGRLWVMRGPFWCKFQFGVGRNLWVMGYGILGVWVKTTVMPAAHQNAVRQRDRRSNDPN